MFDPISNVELVNTFDYWRLRTNDIITRMNSIASVDGDVYANSAQIVGNTSPNMLTLYNDSDPSVSNEARIVFQFKDTVSTDEFGRIAVSPSNVTDSSEESDMVFSISQGGAIADALTISANGQLSVPLALNYEVLVNANNVITNRKYVTDADDAVLDDALAFAIALG